MYLSKVMNPSQSEVSKYYEQIGRKFSEQIALLDEIEIIRLGNERVKSETAGFYPLPPMDDDWNVIPSVQPKNKQPEVSIEDYNLREAIDQSDEVALPDVMKGKGKRK
jgi:hypothetical protein